MDGFDCEHSSRTACNRAQSRERDSRLKKEDFVKKQQKKEEKRLARATMLATVDAEEEAPEERAAPMTPKQTDNSANIPDGPSPTKPLKKAKTRASSEGSKENLKEQLDADANRGRTAATNVEKNGQLRPRARSAMKRQLEQEKAEKVRKAKAEALEKERAEEEEAAGAARRQAKWETRQEAAALAAKKEQEEQER